MTRIQAARMFGQSGRIEPITEGNGDDDAHFESLLERWSDRKHTPIRDRWHAENGVWRR